MGPGRAGRPGDRGKLGELGFLGLTIPEEYGGTGGDHLAYCLVMEELGRGDSAVRGIVSRLASGWSPSRSPRTGARSRSGEWLPRLASGETLGCFGLTEPGIGSDAGNLTTRAVRDGDDWLITGAKMFITNGTWADVALVFARTGGPAHRGRHRVPGADRHARASTRREIKGKLGLRGQATAELVLDECGCRDAARLGDEGKGFRVAMSALDKGRMSVAAGCVGIAQGCLDAAVGVRRASASSSASRSPATSSCRS